MAFNNKDDAQKELDKIISKTPTVLCPLLGKTCDPACIVFEVAMIYETSEGYEIKGANCQNETMKNYPVVK